MKLLFLFVIPILIFSCGAEEEAVEEVQTEDSVIVEEVDTLPPFESIPSNFNTTDLLLPEGFTYRVIFSEGDMVTRPDGEKFPAKGKHDLTVFIPDDTDPDKGILYISHETSGPNPDLGDGGGATVFDLVKSEGKWDVSGDFHHIDFSPVGLTNRNCGGSLSQSPDSPSSDCLYAYSCPLSKSFGLGISNLTNTPGE